MTQNFNNLKFKIDNNVNNTRMNWKEAKDNDLEFIIMSTTSHLGDKILLLFVTLSLKPLI